MKNNLPTVKKSHLNANQLSALGLRCQPFNSQTEKSDLFNDSQQEMTSNIILKSLYNDNKAVVLLAEQGTGKTTYLRKILHKTKDDVGQCVCQMKSGQSFNTISVKIKHRWALSDADLSIENHVICYLQHHPKLLLVIDDADHLDLASLAQLFQLKHRLELTHPHALGLVMTGGRNLKLKIIRLEQANPTSSANYQINIRALNRDQTHRYIQHQLNNARTENNIVDDSLLDSSSLDNIYNHSQGNFNRIHEATIEALTHLAAHGPDDQNHKSLTVSSVMITCLLITLVLLAYYLARQLGLAY